MLTNQRGDIHSYELCNGMVDWLSAGRQASMPASFHTEGRIFRYELRSRAWLACVYLLSSQVNDENNGDGIVSDSKSMNSGSKEFSKY